MNNNINYLKEEEITLSNKKLTSYLEKENETINKLKDAFSNLLIPYKSNITNKLIESNNSIIQSLKNTYQNHLDFNNYVKEHTKKMIEVKEENIRNAIKTESELR